jgi:hypothetical protein
MEIDRPYLFLGGKVTIIDDGAVLRFTKVYGGRFRDAVPLRERIIDALRCAFFDRFDEEVMLYPQCLCRGKTLTDPVSQARFIGPECFGSSSVRVPWLREHADV